MKITIWMKQDEVKQLLEHVQNSLGYMREWVKNVEVIDDENGSMASGGEGLEVLAKDGRVKVTLWERVGRRKVFTLDRYSVERGLRVFMGASPKGEKDAVRVRHYADWKDATHDATTASVFFQCCLFGEVVFD
jgi:hypothetical protein